MSADVKSLQELSFENVRKHFSRHTAAYKISTNETLKKNLYFLQRVYTHTLFFELEENNELEEEHFDFLLNESLKKLDVGILLSCSTKEKVLEKVLPITHGLHELSWDYYGRHAEDSIFIFSKLIPLSNNVKKINIPSIANDDLLKLIGSSCSSLVELNIEGSENVTGEGIKALCLNLDVQIQNKCPLKYLNLTQTNELPIEDIALLLKNLPTLEEVLYANLPNAIESIHLLDIDNNIVSDMKQLNLQSLDFIPYEDPLEITKLLTLCAERCPKIKKLSVPVSNAEDLELVGRFSNLENLTVVCYDVMDLNSFLISKGKNLKVLTVDSFSLSVSTLLENCPNLETLILKTIQYQGLQDKNSTKVLNRLKKLQFESVIFLDYHCTDNVMMLLNSSPNLESLSLLYCDFTESDIIAKLSTFSLNCNLSHLHFDYSDVGVDLLQQFILNCNSIKSLSLDNCENISLDDICMLNQTIEASNRKILISYTDGSEFSYSDYELGIDDGDENDYDIDEFHGFELYDEYDDYEDDDDYDDYDGIHHDFW